MKLRSNLLPLAVLLLILWPFSIQSQTLITFDDLQETASGSFIANGYQGLSWSNFWAANGILDPRIFPFITNGYYYGTVSGSNFAFNAAGGPAEIDSLATNFNFLSAYLTGSWNSNLNIEVQGFNGATLLYDTTVVASATAPALFDFDFENINRLVFTSSGGQPAFNFNGGNPFVIDNFSFEFVPEPSSLLMAGFATLALWPFLKRKRT